MRYRLLFFYYCFDCNLFSLRVADGQTAMISCRIVPVMDFLAGLTEREDAVG